MEPKQEQKEPKRCRCNKCSCGSNDQALFCSVLEKWLCKDCADGDEHNALHVLLKEENNAIVYPTDFQVTVLKCLGDQVCVSATQHALAFEALLNATKDKRIAALLKKNG